MQRDSTPPESLHNWFNKKFIQFAESTSSTFNPSICSPRHHRTQSFPSYMSPTKSQLGLPGEEFVIGCSVCGTRAIEETCFAEHPAFNGIDNPNSGAYARIIAYYEKPLEALTKTSTELKALATVVADPEFDKEFEVSIEANNGSPVMKKIVYKEFSPPGKNPLTPLNYKEKQLVKECFYNNPTAKKFVKEEERKIVASRRNEYLLRSAGQAKTFVRTDAGHVRSKLISKTPSEAALSKSATQSIITSKGSQRGRKKNIKGEKVGAKGYTFNVTADEDAGSSSSDMVIHFQMPQRSSGLSTPGKQASGLNTPGKKPPIQRSSPGSRSESPLNLSISSNKSSKQFLIVPSGPKARSRSPSPSPEKTVSKLGGTLLPPSVKSSRNSRSASPAPNSLAITQKASKNLRSPSPSSEYLTVTKKPSEKSRSPSPSQDSLRAPSKSPKSSRSSSPFSDTLKAPQKSSGSRSPSNKSPLHSPKGSQFLYPKSTGSKASSKSSKAASNKGGIAKGNKKQLRSVKKKKSLPPLPKLFEPRCLREVFVVQEIAAKLIQRAFRKSRETKKKRSETSQWEPKDFAGDCRFTSEELFKAMKLLGSFAEFMESQGRKII